MDKCCPSSCCCDKGSARQDLMIDFMYLDLSVCGRCRGTDEALEGAVDEASALLGSAGFNVSVRKTLIDTRQKAIQEKFLSSPTIRVNGKDISGSLKESKCEDCGSLCGADVDCRVWEFEGEEYTVPPKQLIVRALLKAAVSPGTRPDPGEYKLPDNLDAYFRAVEGRSKT